MKKKVEMFKPYPIVELMFMTVSGYGSKKGILNIKNRKK